MSAPISQDSVGGVPIRAASITNGSSTSIHRVSAQSTTVIRLPKRAGKKEKRNVPKFLFLIGQQEEHVRFHYTVWSICKNRRKITGRVRITGDLRTNTIVGGSSERWVRRLIPSQIMDMNAGQSSLVR